MAGYRRWRPAISFSLLVLIASVTGCIHSTQVQDSDLSLEQRVENAKNETVYRATESPRALDTKLTAESVNGTSERHVIEGDIGRGGVISTSYSYHTDDNVTEIEYGVDRYSNNTGSFLIIRRGSFNDRVRIISDSADGSGEVYDVELGNQTTWRYQEYETEFLRAVRTAKAENYVNDTDYDVRLNLSKEFTAKLLNDIVMTHTGRDVLGLSGEDIEHNSGYFVFGGGFRGVEVSAETRKWDIRAEVEALSETETMDE